MTLLYTVAVVSTIVANGCTFCVLHEGSKFEADCHARGGQLRTLATTQTCVTDAGHVAGLVRDDDAGN